MKILGFVFIYLIVINIATFITFAVDKHKAKRDKWRVSENTLVTLMFIGGALGADLAMEKVHHKTNKFKFKIARVVSYVTFALIIGFAFYLGF